MTIRIVNPGESLQAAIDASTWGDVIKLRAGQVYDTPGRFTSFNLTDKGTPPTGTDADYITITTDDPAGTPAALSNYPREDVRPTAAMAVRMPCVRTVGSYPVFWVNRGAKYWKVERLNITNVAGSGTVRLVGNGEEEPRNRTECPDRIIFQLNWLHPAEEDGLPLTAATLHRSAENAFYLEGTNIILRQNAMTGFVGRYSDGSNFSTSCHLMTTWADNVLVENNLLEGWTYAVFYGGGTKGIADPAFTATVSNCTPTSAVFSNVNGLVPGKPVAVLVYSHDDGGILREVWGTAFVKSVVGNLVTYVSPLCNSNNTGGNGNVCKPFDSANLRQLPADGSPARWEGYQVQNVLVRRNIFAHRPEWIPLMNNQCGGKGYLEVKSGRNVTFDGNIFKGCTGPTVTTRNQSGADPWNNLDNLTFSNNWWQNANAPLTAYLNDGGNLTSKTKGYKFVNNLVVGEYADPNEFSGLRVTAVTFSGGEDAVVAHNTVLVGSSRNFLSFSDPRSQMDRLVMENNIIRAAYNLALSGDGESSAPITECWPGAMVRKNVLLHIDRSTPDEIRQTWTDPFPDNSLVTATAAVGFTNAPLLLDASVGTEGYKLRSDSRFKGAGTDGRDVGCDIDQLNATIFGTGAPPPPPIDPPPPPPTPPTPSPDGTKAVTIIEASGVTWTLNLKNETLRNSIHVGDGRGTIYKYLTAAVYVFGGDRNWYKWTTRWVNVGPTEPGTVTQPIVGSLKQGVAWNAASKTSMDATAKAERALGYYFHKTEAGNLATFVYTGVKLTS